VEDRQSHLDHLPQANIQLEEACSRLEMRLLYAGRHILLPRLWQGSRIRVMKKAFRVIFVFALFMAAGAWAAGASLTPETTAPVSGNAKAIVIPCKGTIDQTLFYSIKRRSEIALRSGADYLIYQMETYGGMLDAADSIAKYMIQQAASRGHTVAYITTEAISAGALISASCQDIIMRENTTIGDAAPITLGGKLEGIEREKAESFLRAAEANGYPALLLKAMVTMQIEVYRVLNLRTGQYEFFEKDSLPKDPNKYEVEKAEMINGSDELLTLTASKALEYGIARAVVKDLNGAMSFIEKRDHVVFAEEPAVLNPSWSELMVSWLNSPIVMGILFMLALLGAYIEFSTPGFGLPGLVAVICFALILGSKYLVGMANWVEVLLLLIGVALLLVEIFVLPGFGVAGILGIACILVGLFGMLIRNAPDEFPWPHTSADWQSLSSGVIGLGVGFAGFLVAAWLLSRYLPKIPFARGLILSPAVAAAGRGGAQVSMTSPPDSASAGVQVSDVGEVLSTLRPAGKARFGDAIVDVVATGEFLDRGTAVRIIEIYGSRVVVKKAEPDDEA
jgi:membrane-bound serine protease (ClpP class)